MDAQDHVISVSVLSPCQSDENPRRSRPPRRKPRKRGGRWEDKFSTKSPTVSMPFGKSLLWWCFGLPGRKHSRIPLVQMSERRADIVKAVSDGLRFTPIAAALDSRVMLPPAYLSSKRGLKYSEMYTSLKVRNLADLKFPESELAGSAWEMPLSLLVRGRADVRIIEKNGVQLLTDSIANPLITGGEGPSAYKRSQAAAPVCVGPAQKPLSLHVESLPARLDGNIDPQGQDGLVTSNESAKRRKTGQYAAGELCHGNLGRVEQTSPMHNKAYVFGGRLSSSESESKSRNPNHHKLELCDPRIHTLSLPGPKPTSTLRPNPKPLIPASPLCPFRTPRPASPPGSECHENLHISVATVKVEGTRGQESGCCGGHAH
ncbi:hypothetical protein N657DRAFT_443384 [Parathielavia appendiculata]|uniref:Uncharacterized protein n=1 Tax=Parathielavia appendiculata TaxID=2587402 RepID=A0AAN6TP10_9PEZI|nr:hypothetical protein N657DRAFT_443384 [Parathielavia appendiculata]